MVPGEGVCKSFVVSGESAETRCPGEAALDDPPSWQKYEAAFGGGMLDHFELDAVLGRSLGCSLAGVSLIDIGQLHAVSDEVSKRCERGFSISLCSSRRREQDDLRLEWRRAAAEWELVGV